MTTDSLEKEMTKVFPPLPCSPACRPHEMAADPRDADMDMGDSPTTPAPRAIGAYLFQGDSDDEENAPPEEIECMCTPCLRDLCNNGRAACALYALGLLFPGSAISGNLPKQPEPHEPHPWIYFVCTGVSRNGKRVHDLLHIGTSKERFDWWPQLQEQRNAARNDLIGEGAISAWKRQLQKLITLDGDKKEDISTIREKAILKSQDWDSLETTHADLARDLTRNPLRPCQQHLGQAFSLGSWGKAKIIGCCYFCKLSLRYDEIKEDKLEIAKRINLDARRKVRVSGLEGDREGGR